LLTINEGQETRLFVNLKDKKVTDVNAIKIADEQEKTEPIKKIKSKTFTIPDANIEMVWIKPGKFRMGDIQGGGDSDEQPVHEVIINNGFWMGKYEVTQKQWQTIMSNNPSFFQGDNLPVEKVSWSDSKLFCEKLSKKTGLKIRLPSEAEWEYACRGGAATKYYNGNKEEDLKKIAWYHKNSNIKTHPVGKKDPNNFGLYDMSGNVWEWCEDMQNKSYKNAPNDGKPWMSGDNKSDRVIRGGSWYFYAMDCRSASRNFYSFDYHRGDRGFRVVREAE